MPNVKGVVLEKKNDPSKQLSLVHSGCNAWSLLKKVVESVYNPCTGRVKSFHAEARLSQ